MTIRIAELFAGVGGFRLGLDGYHDAAHPEFDMKPAGDFKTVWANQWEPNGQESKQFAWRCYEKDSAREVALMKISPLCYKKSRTVSGRFLSSTCWLAVFRVRIIQWRSLLPLPQVLKVKRCALVEHQRAS